MALYSSFQQDISLSLTNNPKYVNSDSEDEEKIKKQNVKKKKQDAIKAKLAKFRLLEPA